MQQKLTWILVIAAASLFAFILLIERKIPGTAERQAPKSVLPVNGAEAIGAVQVSFPSGGVVRAEKTNGIWTLTKPEYPAIQGALETFVTNLVELRAMERLRAKEVIAQGQKSFGFDPPRASVEVQFRSNQFRFDVGGIAPLTSNLYLRVPPSGDVLLVQSSLLKSLPKTTNDWRSPALLQIPDSAFDHIQIQAGQRLFELTRNVTNKAWQISKPLPARADQNRVLELLHLLHMAEAAEFVTDSPGADLERFGLQAPEVEVTFTAGTNQVYDIEFGNMAPNRTNEVYARLMGKTNIVLAPRQLAAYLKQPYKSYHDPRLVVFNPAVLDRVMIRSRESFVLQKDSNGAWIIENDAKTPVDRDLLVRFINAVASLQILDIVREVPAETDLKSLGFLPPSASYTFFEKFTNPTGVMTNMMSTDVLFGGVQNDKIFVRRSDENPVYLTMLAPALELPKRAFELRDRKLWRFDPTNVVSITLSNGRSTNTLTRNVTGWTQDPVSNAAIEEVVFRLGRLDAQDWTEKGRARLGTFGFNENSVRLGIELRTPAGNPPLMLHFGRQTLRHDAYGAITFPGETEPTIFEFPGDVFHMMQQNLPMPK